MEEASERSAVGTELRKFLAPEFIFGPGALALTGHYARRLGAHRLLVVSDAGVTAAGWTGKVLDSLDAAGVRYSVFDDVHPDPSAEEVMAGAERFRAADADALLAVGGGSPLDCAKGIGIVIADGLPITQFEGVDQVAAPMPPMLCVPTTGGTGADVSQFAIITHRQQRRKIVIASRALVPDLSLVDPECLVTMDAQLTACSGLDALSHACEALVSNGSSPVTDVHALEAIRLVGGHLLDSLARPADAEARRGMALASLQAGIAFSNASLGLAHAMAHALGGYRGICHGECVALLLEPVVAFNFPAAPERYRRAAAALGVVAAGRSDEDVCTLLQEALRSLRRRVGLADGLARLGMTTDDIPVLAANALKDPCLVTNPRPAGRRDVERLYAQAL